MQTDNFLKVAIRAAVKAGDYAAGKMGRTKSVRYKGDINVVTDVDKRCEDIIVSTIRKNFPRHNFLAEENDYPERNKDFLWIIDPLDGTTNFLHSFPFFCVSIALLRRGEILAGCVYDPIRKELFCAEKNKGSFLNKKKIHVSKIREVKKALVATGFAYNVKNAKNKNIANFVRFLKASQAVRRAGSAALDLCYVACGRFDGFWEFCLNPWDTAAGVLIVDEAGGRTSKVDGSDYSVFHKELLSSNSRLHAQMVNILSA